MRNHAEILRDLAANFDIIDSIGESIFILFHRLGKFSLFLRIDAAIEQFDRIIGHRLGVLFSARRLCLSPCGLRNRKLCGKRTIRLGCSVGRSALRTSYIDYQNINNATRSPRDVLTVSRELFDYDSC